MKTKILNHKHIVDVFDIFKKVNPTLNYGNNTYRDATFKLFETEGYVKTIAWGNYSITIHKEEYAPKIFNPYELMIKLPNLKLFWNKHKEDESYLLNTFQADPLIKPVTKKQVTENKYGRKRLKETLKEKKIL